MEDNSTVTVQPGGKSHEKGGEIQRVRVQEERDLALGEYCGAETLCQRLISKEFVNNQIDTQILVNESSDYRCMFDTHMTNWERGYQIQSFFNPDSTTTYLGDTPNVPRLMAGHSYWTNTPLNNLHDIRCQLKDTLDKYKVDFWQTETCIMGNDEEIGGGGGYDFTMKTALYVARIIHHDIVYAGARSWQWWRSWPSACKPS